MHVPKQRDLVEESTYQTHTSVSAPIFLGEVNARTLLSNVLNADQGSAQVNFQMSAETVKDNL
eukprot:5673594-Prorocentrum_lima.AAC.1